MRIAGMRKLAEVLEAARNLPPPEPETPISPHGSDTPPATVRGVPRARLGDTFAAFDLTLNPGMKVAVARCKAVAAGKAWCALLAGDFGTGKTHLAIAAFMDWMAQGRGGYFWKVPDFLDWLRYHGFDEDGMGLQAALRIYQRANGLVIFDDLGTENPTDWAHEQLYRVLDSRYDQRLPTIITTNQPLDRIDGRIRSRFREGLVVCAGRDMRARKGGRDGMPPE
jgi:DNA replication protein DnaC